MKHFELDGIEVDVAGNRLRRDGIDIHLEPKVMRVLRHLMGQAGEVVSREALLDDVWAGQVVEDDALSAAVIKLRKALGDSARDPRFIATVPKVGYRLIAPVRETGDGDGTNGGEPPVGTGSAPGSRGEQGVTAHVPGNPSISVLGFESHSEDPDQRYLAEGLAEDIAGALSRLRWLTVIDRAGLPDQASAASGRRFAHELGIDFLVRGTVRRSGERLRVTVRLERAATGERIWSERYDRELADLFEIEDDICTFVLARLEVEINAAEQQRVVTIRRANLSAWEAYQRGLFARQGRVGVLLSDAKAYFRQAMERDPGFAAPRAAFALAAMQEVAWGLIPPGERDASLREAMALTEEAIRRDPREALAFVARARLRTAEGENEAALDDVRAALELNPNSATAIVVHAAVQAGYGDPRIALSELDRASRLASMDPYLESIRYGAACIACLRLDQPAEAARWGELGTRSLQSATWSTALGAVAHRALGNENRARELIDELRGRRPDLTLSGLIGRRRVGDPGFHRWLVDHLQALGLAA